MLHRIRRYISIGKKLLIIAVVYGIIVGVFFNSIAKNKPKISSEDTIKTNREKIYKMITNPEYQKTPEGKLLVTIYRKTLCYSIGEACTNNPQDADKNNKSSLIGMAAGLIALPYLHPPASGIYWARSGLENAGFIPHTYAAEGIGFAGIKPFSKLWGVFRDISYMLLVLIIVSIGFMIMFRMKINPQTVISVESALPRIVLSLILITFSFPIAGFLIDLMYVTIAITISVMSNNNTYYDAGQFQKEYLNANFATIWNSMFPAKSPGTPLLSGVPGLDGISFLGHIGNSLLKLAGPVEGIIRVASGIFGGVYGFIKPQSWFGKQIDVLNNWVIAAFSAGNLPGAIISTIVQPVTGIIAGSFFAFLLPQLVLGFLVLFTMLLLLFRIFFLLMRSYLQIIILVIFAPVIILFGAIPGKNAFSYWFKTLFVEILTFPIVIAVFVLGYILVNTLNSPNVWTPPFLYGIDPSAFATLAGLGLIFITPDLVKMARELLGVKGLPIGLNIGTFFAGAGVGLGGGVGLLHQYSSLGYVAAHLPGPLAERLKGLPGFGEIIKAFSGAERQKDSTS